MRNPPNSERPRHRSGHAWADALVSALLAGAALLLVAQSALAVDLPALPVSSPALPPTVGISVPIPGAQGSPTAAPSPPVGDTAVPRRGVAAASNPPLSAAPARPSSLQADTSRALERESGGRVRVPFTQIVLPGSPLDVALLVAIGALPLLLAIWLLAFGRAWVEARRRQDAGLRLALAGELGLSPRELKSLTPRALLKLREQVTFDGLTGTLRRAPGVAAVEREVARARRLKESLSVAFIDVDNLKRANDSRGHAAGDRLLKGVAQLLQEQLRGQDLIFRFGGDEFVCLLPETGIIVAQETLVRLQDEAAERQLPFSFGVAELEPGDDTVSLLGRADSRLYEAKQGHSWARPMPDRWVRPTVVSN